MNAIGGTTGQLSPTLWQRAVLAIPETFNIAMLGGRAPGKTTGSLFVALRHVKQYGAAAKVLIVRKTLGALREVEGRLVALFESALPGSAYSTSTHIMRCANGAVVELGYLENESDYEQYQGREATMFIVDEITLWPSLHGINRIRSNLRSAAGVPVRTIFAGNPGGPGHALVSSKFLDSRSPWVPYELGPGDWWVTATGTLDDNPHLDTESYETQLRASAGGDEALFNAWRNNSWSAIGGAFFASQWGAHLYLRDPDWRPSRGWMSFWSIDWGISSPAVALGHVVPMERGLRGPGGLIAPVGSRLVIASVDSHDPADLNRGLNWSVDQLAEAVFETHAEFGLPGQVTGCVDDARGLHADETVAKELQRCKVLVRPAVKGSRVGGWTKLKGMMTAAKRRDPDAPWWLIHERCSYPVETMACLPRNARKIDDCDTTANDHAADAARYGTDYTLPIGLTLSAHTARAIVAR